MPPDRLAPQHTETGWTKDPPTAEGWYWRRIVIASDGYVGDPQPWQLCTLLPERRKEVVEWWPIPITPPHPPSSDPK